MLHTFRLSVAFLGVLFMCTMARGQTISPDTISGPDTLCAGTTGLYSVSPIAGVTFSWTIIPSGFGTIVGPSTGTSVNVLWGIAGTGTVHVVGYDLSHTVVDTGSFTVVVEPAPQPYITGNVRVGCDKLADTTQDRKFPGILDDAHGCVKVCEKSIVTYTGHGFAGDTYGWSVSGGTILAMGGDTCMVQWGWSGTGSITVYDTTQFGCTGSKTICIDIIPKPHAFFTTVPPGLTTACLDETVYFVDASVDSGGSPIVNWQWDFGDGHYMTTSSSTTVSEMYTTPGLYHVLLTVTNACGCKDTFGINLNIFDTTGVNITCPGVVCEGAIDTYYLAPPIPCSSYLWTVSGGTILPPPPSTKVVVQWDHVDTSGFGYLMFNSGPCGVACPGITTIKIPVIQAHGHITGPKIVCAHSQNLYRMPQWPTTVFTWYVTGSTGSTLSTDDQRNEIILNANNPGTVYLKCIYRNTLLGCGGEALDTITVEPADSILGPSKVCQYGTTHDTLAGPPCVTGRWKLTFPDGTSHIALGHTFAFGALTEVGTYVLTVTPLPGSCFQFCPIDPLLIRVDTLPPTPDSIIGPDTVCYGIPATYVAKNAIPGDVFEWGISSGTLNFTDGDHTEATFTGAGPDVIWVMRATKSSPHCYSRALPKTVYRPYVHLHITGTPPDTVCPSSYAVYDAGYYEGETYSWTVLPTSPSPGSVVTDGSPTATILWNNIPGPAQVVVKVRKCDTFYYDTLTVHVRDIPPTAIITAPATICRGVGFTATSSVPGTITWSWGDGTSDVATGSSDTHIYHTLSGSSLVDTISVSIASPYGCTATITGRTTITVLPAPVANITPDGPFVFCVGPPGITLTATLQSGYEPTDTLEWWQSPSGIEETWCLPPFVCSTYTPPYAGTYYVIAVGHDGCRDTSNYVIIDSLCDTGVGPCVLTPEPTLSIDTAVNYCGVVHLHGTYSGPPPTAITTHWGWPVPQAKGVTTTANTLDCYFDVAGLYDFTYGVLFTDGTDTCWRTTDTHLLVPLVAGMGYEVGCSGGSYSVELLDHSNYYPGWAPGAYSWYINGVFQTMTSPGSANTWTTTLPPGAYSVGEWVHYGPGNIDSCWTSDSLYLDTLPVAGFTFARDTTCAQQASVQFTNTSVPVSGLTYLWDFNDGTGNSQENPYKVYGSPLLSYSVTLTVTNSFGCRSTVTEPVPIVGAPLRVLNGRIVSPTSACEGTPILLSYFNTGTSMPDTFLWINDRDTMYYTLTGSTDVYYSGAYWIHGSDHYGCWVNTLEQVVNFTQVPPAVIDGDKSQCYGVPYTLNGWAGDDPTISYKWYKNGSAVGTGSTYTDPALTVGTFDYMLIVSVPLIPGPGTCSDTTYDTVTVHLQPPAPGILLAPLSCNPYSFQLTAVGPLWGTYNWSDGDYGMVDTGTVGGPYRVWYTDTFGCVSYNDINVPKDPKEYLWVFPTGCYGPWCKGDTTHYIVGPIAPFVYWAYQASPTSGPIIKSGSGIPDSLHVDTTGSFDLILDNGLCTDTSGTMSVVFVPCAGCETPQMTLYSYMTSCDTANPKDTCCLWYIVMGYYNTDGYPLYATYHITGGVLTPGGGVLNPGMTVDTFGFIPDTSFAGGWEYFTITYTDSSGVTHECEDSVYLAPCHNHHGPKGEAITGSDGSPALALIPNPAQNSTRVDFAMGSERSAGAIEVYDMTGRLMSSYTPPNSTGSWQLRLDNYAAGIYIVVLKENGHVVKQQKLSITR